MYNFNENLLKLQEEKIKLTKLNKKLSSLEKEIIKTNETLNSLKKIMNKEKKDVDKLESFSLTYIFYKLKGSIDEKISKEKYEFLEANAKYIETKDYLDRLYLDKNNMLKEISNIGNIDSKYESLLNEYSNYILSLNNYKSDIVSNILTKIKDTTLEKREINEALLEGDKLIPTINKAISNLESAKNWGVYDMLGGDLLATMAKRSKMNDASNSINSIKVLLKRYNSELNDLSNNINLSLNITGLSSAMDYFFDNFFTDYFIQGKINNALDSTIKLKLKVNETQSNLTNQLKNCDLEIKRLKKKLEEELKSL